MRMHVFTEVGVCARARARACVRVCVCVGGGGGVNEFVCVSCDKLRRFQSAGNAISKRLEDPTPPPPPRGVHVGFGNKFVTLFVEFLLYMLYYAISC